MKPSVRLLLGLGIVVFSLVFAYGIRPLTAQASAEAANHEQAGKIELEKRLLELASSLGHPAVNARVDRVWHAVPGLSGWTLNMPASLLETKRHNDQQLHLIWQPVAPRTSLRDLPAEPIYRGSDGEKSLSLMFNVSWGEEYLPSILNTLAKYHVKATFFLDGAWVKRYPDLAQDISKAGHAIGSHGSGHPDFRHLSNGSLERQVTMTNQTISKAVGKSVILIAPPAGAYDGRLVEIAHRHGQYTILWTTDTVDWRRPPASVIVQRATTGLTNGSLILMHPTDPTAQALPTIIATLQNRGYSFKTVGDVVEEKRSVVPPSVLSKHP